MPTLYKLLTAVLALTGCASVGITGQINPVMASGALALVPGYYRFLRGERPAPVMVIGLLSLIELVIFLFDSLVVSGDVFIAVAHLTMAFQALKSFDLKEPWDHLQVYFVSLLQLVIASELTSSLAFGAIFVVFLVGLVAAMVLSHFIKEGRPVSLQLRQPVFLITLLTLLLTAFFFVIIPRTSHRFIGKSHARGIHTTGFSERMDFGSFGDVKLDPTVVMRVEMRGDLQGQLYWRGHTLDHFDGVTWSNELPQRRRIYRTADEFISVPYEKSQAVEQEIYLEPLDSDVIFGLPRVMGVRTDLYSLMEDPAGNLFIPGKSSRRIRYTALSIPSRSMPGAAEPRYLQVPQGNERIAGLADSVAGAVPDAGQKALAVEEYLRKNYEYSLSVQPPPEGTGPIEDFLFRARKGFCEHYASAMVLMLRSLGIHSRIVTGFIGGERNEYGGYTIIRKSDAHSWVEALIKGNWVRFDPTPAVAVRQPGPATLVLDSLKMKWARYIVGFSSKDQSALLGTLSSVFGSGFQVFLAGRPGETGIRHLLVPVLVLVLFAALVLLIARAWPVRRYGAVTASFVRVRKALFRGGLEISASTTPGDISELAKSAPYAASLRAYLDKYNRMRFGRQASGGDIMRQADLLAREIKKAGRAGKKWFRQ